MTDPDPGLLNRSHGSKPIYFTRGYKGEGWIAGFNSRFGGYSVWIRPRRFR